MRGINSVGPVWRVVPGQTLQHRVWDDECVLYDSLTGHTQLIEASALQVLLALQPAPLDEASLTAALREALDLTPDEAADVPALMADLKALALIETLPC